MKAIAVLVLPLLTAVAQTAQAQELRKPSGAPSARHETARANPTTSKPSPAPNAPAVAPSPFAATSSTYAPHYTSPLPGRPSVLRRLSPYSLGYGYSEPYVADVAAPAGEPRDSSSAQKEPSGTLRLEVEPRTAQVYADGFYIGTVDDFERWGVTLAAGRHSVDLRAPGYETMTIPVDIASTFTGAAEPTRFRGALIPVRIQPQFPVPPRGSKTMYVIAGCYAGNRPPRESSLARGCDIARLHVITN